MRSRSQSSVPTKVHSNPCLRLEEYTDVIGLLSRVIVLHTQHVRCGTSNAPRPSQDLPTGDKSEERTTQILTRDFDRISGSEKARVAGTTRTAVQRRAQLIRTKCRLFTNIQCSCALYHSHGLLAGVCTPVARQESRCDRTGSSSEWCKRFGHSPASRSGL